MHPFSATFSLQRWLAMDEDQQLDARRGINGVTLALVNRSANRRRDVPR